MKILLGHYTEIIYVNDGNNSTNLKTWISSIKDINTLPKEVTQSEITYFVDLFLPLSLTLNSDHGERNFLRLNLVTISLCSFPSSKHFNIPHFVLEIHWLRFTNCYCIQRCNIYIKLIVIAHIYNIYYLYNTCMYILYIHVHICFNYIYLVIYIYILFSLYNATCMFVFRVYHLAMMRKVH